MNILEAIKEGKEFQTTDGKPVRILDTNFKDSNFPIVAAVFYGKELGESLATYTLNGTFYNDGSSNHMDLIIKLNKVTKWVNIFKRSNGQVYTGINTYDSKEDAENPLITSNVEYLCTKAVELEL